MRRTLNDSIKKRAIYRLNSELTEDIDVDFKSMVMAEYASQLESEINSLQEALPAKVDALDRTLNNQSEGYLNAIYQAANIEIDRLNIRSMTIMMEQLNADLRN